MKARHGFRVSPWCWPVLTSPFTHREQLQSRHQVQRPSPAQASPAAPTDGSPALHGEALHHSHWSCSFGQTLADSPLQNLCLLPIIRAGSPNSSAEPSELENRALFLSPTSHSPLHAVNPSVVSVSHLGLLLICSLVRPGTLLSRQLRPRLSHTGFPGPLKRFSPLRPTALSWNLSHGIYPRLLCIHDISQQCGRFEGRTLGACLLSSHRAFRERVTELTVTQSRPLSHLGRDPVLVQAVRGLV